MMYGIFAVTLLDFGREFFQFVDFALGAGCEKHHEWNQKDDDFFHDNIFRGKYSYNKEVPRL